MKKKGAVELSITTIVVIIIGLAILGYGLVWVKDIFDKTGDLSEKAFEQAAEELEKRMGGGTGFNLQGTDFEVKRGDRKIVAGVVKNTERDGISVKIDVKPISPAKMDWVKIVPSTINNMGASEIARIKMELSPGSDSSVGDTYYYEISAKVGSNLLKGTERMMMSVTVTP